MAKTTPYIVDLAYGLNSVTTKADNKTLNLSWAYYVYPTATQFTFNALDGNDTITTTGSAGASLAIYGDKGNDTINVNGYNVGSGTAISAGVFAYGGDGNDKLVGETGNDTYLHTHPEDFGIVLGESGHLWRSRDGTNTHEVRQDRLSRFNGMVSSLGLSQHNYATEAAKRQGAARL